MILKKKKITRILYFEQQFSVFKQHYTYFYTLFHPHVFSKNTNNVIRTTLSNGLTMSVSTKSPYVFFFISKTAFKV